MAYFNNNSDISVFIFCSVQACNVISHMQVHSVDLLTRCQQAQETAGLWLLHLVDHLWVK